MQQKTALAINLYGCLHSGSVQTTHQHEKTTHTDLVQHYNNLSIHYMYMYFKYKQVQRYSLKKKKEKEVDRGRSNTAHVDR